MVAPVEETEAVATEEIAGAVASVVGVEGIAREHEAVEPPFEPVQAQRYSVEESGESEREPREHELLVVPQEPETGEGEEPPPEAPV